MKDNIGVIAYGINQSTTTEPSYTTIEATTNATSSYTASAAGTYVIWVKDVAGRIATTSFTISQNLFCAFKPNQVWKFDYTGDFQSFTVPCSGTYKLEVWGAQGGYDKVGSESQGTLVTVYGGKGGYSEGKKDFTLGTSLFIVVGGKGGDCEWTSAASGGYNGGGSNADKENEGGGGGGATHIATTNRGILKNYSNYRSEVLIVAGGGGGAHTTGFHISGHGWCDSYSPGGAGGGETGGIGKSVQKCNDGYQKTLDSLEVADQNDGYAFGEGYCLGGGGWYGNRGGYHVGYTCSEIYSGGGGSGYIGGVTNGSMQNGVREGNGYAKITLISIN